MRTHTMILVLAASLACGCKWTDFDDLSDETWVNSTEKPDVRSSDYGVAIQRVARSGNGGRLAVIGAGAPTLSELAYGPEGDSSLPPTAVELSFFSINNVGTQPILLANPGNDAIALVVSGMNGVAIVHTEQGDLKAYQVFGGEPPTAATYMRAPGQAKAHPLVAVGDTVYGAVLPELPAGTPQPSCKLIDSASPTTALQIRSLGVVSNGATDDVLAWDASGKLHRYPSSVFNGCAPSQAQTASVDAGFVPDPGSQILAVDDTTVALQGHRGDNGFIRTFRSPAPAMLATLGEAANMPKVRSATILKVASGSYVVAGAPTELVDGKSAGQVRVFKIEPTGLNTIAVATLNDAQPENNQSFGRSVAALPFNGSQVIAVAADNEVFVYFRANQSDGTPLYGETRQGR